jgi:NAD(P)-dependent dehydrogenase (short-subunit alcohol dehydrogenase family)
MVMTIDFAGQVAVVTGAGGGIGKAIAMALAERGASVLVNDYGGSPFGDAGSIDRAQAVADEIEARGGRAFANATAVGSAANAGEIVGAALERFGRLDILVNNAGIVHYGAIEEMPDAALDRVLTTNLAGAFRLVQAAWPAMRRQGYGRILNISSNSALGFGGISAYAVSKSGLLGLTAETAIEGAPLGIQVNSLLPIAATRLGDANPGSLVPPQISRWMNRHFQPAGIVPAALLLLSRSSRLSGAHISTGGGRVSRLWTVAAEGFHSADLSPEMLDRDPSIMESGKTRRVGSGLEEMSLYLAAIPLGAVDDGPLDEGEDA